jgi:murein DD-endopeptidase MepM/ murein hydrolase activator NlpD
MKSPYQSLETLNPSVTDPENQLLIGLTSNITPTKQWQGKFKLPVDSQACIKDWFGIRRTYYGIGTDITLNGFHSGVDYGICSETHPFDIYAPAAGTVVFLSIDCERQCIIIDHGWGFSPVMAQEQSYIAVGDHVEAGNLIGKIGGTGRVTGPHLHWEVWVNGVQVDPLDWLDKEYP